MRLMRFDSTILTNISCRILNEWLNLEIKPSTLKAHFCYLIFMDIIEWAAQALSDENKILTKFSWIMTLLSDTIAVDSKFQKASLLPLILYCIEWHINKYKMWRNVIWKKVARRLFCVLQKQNTAIKRWLHQKWVLPSSPLVSTKACKISDRETMPFTTSCSSTITNLWTWKWDQSVHLTAQLILSYCHMRHFYLHNSKFYNYLIKCVSIVLGMQYYEKKSLLSMIALDIVIKIINVE